MLHKYLSKFTIDILPSILATIVGAYIVNHYIIPKASPDRPAAAVASTSAEPKPDTKAATAKPAENSADLANLPESAPAKAGDKPVVEKASIEKPEAATTPEPRRHQPALREKAAAKPAPAPAAPGPVLATVGTAPAANASADERRDANDLARAAIERLNRSEPRPQEAARAPETPRAPEAPRVQEAARTVSPPSMQQLPPPIVVATPSVEKLDPMPSAERPEVRRIRPPGDIPTPQPMDLQADAAGTPRSERTNVAEDVLSAAKSVFNSVIPRPFER
ncbi:hypothetical protein J2W51_001479 [Tardiphaga robiniae]|uniref:hypothetical protein n=1 Tax=Tardiphaga robiniae TaxID=943830 RepID=UPI002866EE0C|nr:hypothetical protein [Tardiphaga robiniae]MDR6658937.1 hypothetical protein [Tardiphaga robiniae]